MYCHKCVHGIDLSIGYIRHDTLTPGQDRHDRHWILVLTPTCLMLRPLAPRPHCRTPREVMDGMSGLEMSDWLMTDLENFPPPRISQTQTAHEGRHLHTASLDDFRPDNANTCSSPLFSLLHACMHTHCWSFRAVTRSEPWGPIFDFFLDTIYICIYIYIQT